MTVMQELDTFLEHFGIRGMHWGVRRTKEELRGPTPVVIKIPPGEKISTKGGKRQPTTQDAINSAVLRQRAKASGTQSLSNQDLQMVINRMNLEQSYNKLNPKKLSFGQKATQELLYGDIPNMGLAVAKPALAGKIAKELAINPDKSTTQTGLQMAEALIKARPKRPAKK